MRLRYPDLATEVELRCPSGHPRVVRCHPVHGPRGRAEPFPTLFWLVCPAAVRAMSDLERRGHIARLQAAVRADPELASAVLADHRRYDDERRRQLGAADRAALAGAGIDLARFGGIGGIADRTAVRCLHMHYAHHLSRGSSLGRMVAALLAGDGDGCRAPRCDDSLGAATLAIDSGTTESAELAEVKREHEGLVSEHDKLQGQWEELRAKYDESGKELAVATAKVGECTPAR